MHVAFGAELQPDSDDDEAIARLIDDQVINNYRLQQTNMLAVLQLRARSDTGYPEISEEGELALAAFEADPAVADRFNQRIAALPAEIQPVALQMYANPVLNRYRV